MRCEDAAIDIGPALAGALEPEADARLRDHLAQCAACRTEYARLSELWDGLGALPGDVADSPAMQRRFLAALDTFQTGADQARVQMLEAPAARTGVSGGLRWAGWAAALAASLVVGVVVGVGVGRGSGSSAAQAAAASDLASLRQELHDTRELVTLSLLRQTSASDRLQGVSWTERIDQPGAEVVSALLDALAHDANVNVRLAAVDALARFADRPAVRSGAVMALADDRSPMVQIALIDLVVQLKEPSSRNALQRLVSDEHAEAAVRERAAWGLQHIS